MAWYVKRRREDGTVAQILCEQPTQVVENFYDQEQRGGEVWIEELAGGRADTARQHQWPAAEGLNQDLRR